MTTTDLTVTGPAASDSTAVDLHRPDLHEWAQNLAAAHQIGTALCSTSFAPAHFRGKPDEAAAAILYGSEVGFTPTQALRSIFVIGGSPGLYARQMVALVQRAGHEVWTVSKTDQSVTVAGRRRGSEHVVEETWTIERATRAGYTTNKKYTSDPQSMLYARAASDVCRQIAADALAGLAYSVEEMELGERPVSALPPAQPVTAETFMTPGSADDGGPGEIEIDADETTPEAEPNGQPRPLTDHTRKRMFALLADVDPDATPATQRAGMSAVLGRKITSRSELSEDDALKVIDALVAEQLRRRAASNAGERGEIQTEVSG